MQFTHSTFAEHLARLGRSLDGSVDAFNKAVRSYDSRILPGACKIAEMGVTGSDAMPTVEQVERAARSVAGKSGTEEPLIQSRGASINT